jgi:hypothetical protein
MQYSLIFIQSRRQRLQLPLVHLLDDGARPLLCLMQYLHRDSDREWHQSSTALRQSVHLVWPLNLYIVWMMIAGPVVFSCCGTQYDPSHGVQYSQKKAGCLGAWFCLRGIDMLLIPRAIGSMRFQATALASTSMQMQPMSVPFLA